MQGPLHPRDDEPPLEYAQLFLIHPHLATDSRHGRNPTLNRRLLGLLDKLLREHHRFYPVYLTAKERLDAAADREDTRVIPNPQLRLIMQKGADRRRENLPTTDELALLIPEEEDKPGGRDLILEHRPARGCAGIHGGKAPIRTHPFYPPSLHAAPLRASFS